MRACLGRQFSLHEATLVLGLLLRRYEFSGYAHYQPAVQQVLTFKPLGFTLKLARRTVDGPGSRASQGKGAAAAGGKPAGCDRTRR